ncbi:MAG: glycyl-radical enzyme activating protein [Candidatus Heimdallarchaeota archaeon]|nr:glycyl-radical enzyme activating protein [Candidatus Heimdallarchaeota archaeon]
MKTDTGIIFDIKKFAIHDGPGIRTTIFFKGCFLNCWWCHNPESRKHEIQLVQNEVMGREMSINDLLIEIEKDRIFYDESGGGVTISGGEPFYQYRLLHSLLCELKLHDIRTAVDTTGYIDQDIIASVIDNVDLFLYDIKLIDNKKHMHYTGVSNEIILSNLKYILNYGKKVIIRIPIIPGINTTDKDIEDFLTLFLEYGIKEVNLLPYHRIAEHKYQRLGMTYQMEGIEEPTAQFMEEIREKLLINDGIIITIGG